MTDELRNVLDEDEYEDIMEEQDNDENAAQEQNSLIDEWREDGQMTFDTDEFRIVLNDAWHERKGIRAELVGDCKTNDFAEFPSKVKISERGVKSFAGTLCDLNDRGTDEKIDVWKTILRNKAVIAKAALEGSDDDDSDDPYEELDEDFKDFLVDVYRFDGQPRLGDLREEYDDIREYIKDNDYVFNSGVKIILTEEGEEAAEHFLGYRSPRDVDEEEEAERHLETRPLKFYLDVFDEVHKGDNYLKIWELVSALSANISDHQIHSWAVGQSGKGKTHIKKCLLDFLPDECYVEPSDYSPKAMYYKTKKEGSDVFKNKLVFVDEAESNDSDDMLPLLRKLTGNGDDDTNYESVEDQEMLKMSIEKPITVWFTSVETINDEQLKNRFILTNPDTSSELDEAVNNFQQQRLHRGESLSLTPVDTPILREMIHKIWTETRDYDVVIPFWIGWKQSFNRRLYPSFAALLKIITKINYKKRRIENGRLVATIADFELASDIWNELIETTVAQVDKEALRLMKALPENRNEAVRGATIAEELKGFNTNKVYEKAESLLDTEELGLINMEKPETGNQWRYWAGEDRDKISNPQPSLQDSEETIEEVLGPTPVDATDELKQYVYDTEIWVTEHLNNGYLNYSEGGDNDNVETVQGKDEDGPTFEDQTTDEETEGNIGGGDDTNTVKSLEGQIIDFVEQENHPRYQDVLDHLDNFDTGEVETAIDELLNDGKIYETSPNRIDVV